MSAYDWAVHRSTDDRLRPILVSVRVRVLPAPPCVSLAYTHQFCSMWGAPVPDVSCHRVNSRCFRIPQEVVPKSSWSCLPFGKGKSRKATRSPTPLPAMFAPPVSLEERRKSVVALAPRAACSPLSKTEPPAALSGPAAAEPSGSADRPSKAPVVAPRPVTVDEVISLDRIVPVMPSAIPLTAGPRVGDSGSMTPSDADHGAIVVSEPQGLHGPSGEHHHRLDSPSASSVSIHECMNHGSEVSVHSGRLSLKMPLDTRISPVKELANEEASTASFSSAAPAPPASDDIILKNTTAFKVLTRQQSGDAASQASTHLCDAPPAVFISNAMIVPEHV